MSRQLDISQGGQSIEIRSQARDCRVAVFDRGEMIMFAMAGMEDCRVEPGWLCIDRAHIRISPGNAQAVAQFMREIGDETDQ